MKVDVGSGVEKAYCILSILGNFKDDRKGKTLKVNGIGYIFFK